MQCVFSNDLNTLVETVARVLSSPSEVSPLTPDWIIVPNQDTGRWLQIQLTDRLGSLSNTQMTTLTDFILDVSGTRPTEQLDSDLYWSIATLWREQNPELQEADYLQQVTRLFQLFQRYLIERPDWLLLLGSTSTLGASDGLAGETLATDQTTAPRRPLCVDDPCDQRTGIRTFGNCRSCDRL